MNIFSKRGKNRLDRIIQKGVLCAFDFDGTLCPIVSRKEDARLSEATSERLAILSELTPVAIITGRSLDDILPRLTFSPAYLVGNHGLEGIPGWENHCSDYRSLCTNWERAVRNALPEWPCSIDDIEIENKQYSLAVHFRHTADPEETGRQLLPLLQETAPDARLVGGKCTFSLVPPDGPNKGTALSELMKISQTPSAIYVGDDVTDEDVFRLRRSNLVSIRVEKSPDTAANWHIEKQEDMIHLLDNLISRIKSFQLPSAVPPRRAGQPSTALTLINTSP